MPRPPKIHVHDSVLFVTLSIEQGLLLLCNPIVKLALESALARAQRHHPLTVCHFVVEITHVHMIIRVDNPDDVKGFIERFKTESAHAINRILGRRKRTIWCEGYDSPVVLTKNSVMQYIVYLYTNPAKDNLVRSINDYPGLSSWEMYTKGQHEQECPWIHRPMFGKVGGRMESYKRCQVAAEELRDKAKEWHTLRIDPDAWMECFDIHSPEEKARLNKELRWRIKQHEEALERQRQALGHKVAGRKRLEDQKFDLDYLPDRNGCRMLCVSDDSQVRIRFLEWVKGLIQEARAVYRRWLVGDFTVPYPLGLYPPSLPKLAEPLGLE